LWKTASGNDKEPLIHLRKGSRSVHLMNTQSPKPSVVSAYAALTTAALVWGGSVVAQKVALGPFSPVETSVFRGLGALAILIPLWLWKEGGRKFSKNDCGVFFLLGLGVLGNHLLVLFGLQFIGAGSAGVIIGASPAITAFLSSLIIKDVPFRFIWLGCLVSFIGVAVISGKDGMAGVGSNPVLGGVLVLLALVSWALYTIGCRRTMDRFSPLTVTWTTLLMSLLFEIPLLAINHKVLVTGVDLVPFSGWAALVYVMVFATALGQQAWLYGVDGVGPSRAGIFGNVVPVSALFFSFLILGEPLGVREIGGVGLILLGVWLVNQRAQVRRS
jgi:drug/metabolite transporter (DMT)-like permease